MLDRGDIRLFGNVRFGQDITLDDLKRHYNAVIFATGASTDRRMGVPGEDLAGNATATHVVAWYNGHPDHVETPIDLSGERIVVVGNGNVALDVSRVILSDPDALARTDIADHALEALRTSAVREVVLVARRGPAQAAFTVPEIVGLLNRDDIDVVVPQRELLGFSQADDEAMLALLLDHMEGRV